MVMADSWYTSGTLWAAAGTIAVLVTSAIATYVAFVLASPVRRLECAMTAAPLLQGSAQDMPGLLNITWEGTELRDPNILEVNLVNRGRRDIVGEDFDQSLEFRVGVRILAILRSASGQGSTAFRAVGFKDDLLMVGPALIRRRQSIKFTLLASGRDPVLTSSAAAVRDVDVEVLPTERSSRRWSIRTRAAASLAVAAAMAGLVLIGFLIGRNPPPNEAPTANVTSPLVSQPAIRILSPRNGAHLSGNQSVLVGGTATDLAGEQLWIFVQQSGIYYVSDASPIPIASGRWKFLDPYIGSSSNLGSYQISAVLANASCAAAIVSANQQPGGGVVFNSLPHGCRILDTVGVAREGKK
jgi:hypothetical protein